MKKNIMIFVLVSLLALSACNKPEVQVGSSESGSEVTQEVQENSEDATDEVTTGDTTEQIIKGVEIDYSKIKPNYLFDEFGNVGFMDNDGNFEGTYYKFASQPIYQESFDRFIYTDMTGATTTIKYTESLDMGSEAIDLNAGDVVKRTNAYHASRNHVYYLSDYQTVLDMNLSDGSVDIIMQTTDANIDFNEFDGDTMYYQSNIDGGSVISKLDLKTGEVIELYNSEKPVMYFNLANNYLILKYNDNSNGYINLDTGKAGEIVNDGYLNYLNNDARYVELTGSTYYYFIEPSNNGPHLVRAQFNDGEISEKEVLGEGMFIDANFINGELYFFDSPDAPGSPNKATHKFNFATVQLEKLETPLTLDVVKTV